MTTRKEDAESIVGDELAEELEEKSQQVITGKAMVTKAKDKKADEEEPEDDAAMEDEEEDTGKKKAGGSYLAARAFDGAITLSEAYEHPTQKSYSRLATFALVKKNIEELDEAERLPALSALVDELTDEVMELREAVEDIYLLQPESNVETAPSRNEVSTMTTDYLEQFSQEVETARTHEGTPEERARLMQAALNKVTGAMKAELAGPEAIMANALKAALNPLAEQLAQLNARLGGAPLPQVPVQKSVTGPVVNEGGAQIANGLPVSPITGEPSTFTAIARKSVGLY